jgi:hypothetical protein
MTYHTRAFGLVAALALAPMAASAATVDIQFQAFGTGSPAGITAALAARDAFMGGSRRFCRKFVAELSVGLHWT